MDFKVGPYTYRVTMARGYLGLDGQRCLGLCDHERHLLEVSDQCSPAQRVQVICHEYMEAWLYHFGHAGMDKEAYCDLFGLAMTQFAMDHVPKWCEGVPPVPVSRQTGSDPCVDRRPPGASPGAGAGTQADRQRSRVTGVRVTEHFTPAIREPDNGAVSAKSPKACGGWRVRVMEPVIDPG